MRYWGVVVVVALVASGCFSKPGLRPDDAGSGSDGSVHDAAPIDGMPMPHFYAKISASESSVCAIDDATSLYCWGDNTNGQLGERIDSVGAETGNPGLASTIVGWTAIAAGDQHACGIANEKVYCWGANFARQADPTQSQGTPRGITEVMVPLIGGETPTKIFAGPTTSCTITSAHHAYCWGLIGLTTSGAAPVTVPQQLISSDSTKEWHEIALANVHACALSRLVPTGAIHCWGQNVGLRLGVVNPAIERSYTGVAPIDALLFTSVSANNQNTCATTAAGELFCWGGFGNGILGNRQADSIGVTIASGGGGIWTDVALGFDHACALRGTEVFCYGENTEGARGYGGFDRSVDITGAAATGAVDIIAGAGFSCARTMAGAVTCWGANGRGELGTSQVATKRKPARASLSIPAGEAVLQLVTGDYHSCALVGVSAQSQALCWGNNSEGQVAVVTSLQEPLPRDPNLPGVPVFTMLAAGASHTCGVTTTGSVVCWGDNSQRQLGAGTIAATSVVTQPQQQQPFVYVAAGSNATCAIQSDGELWCWGDVPTKGSTLMPTNYGHVPESPAWHWRSISLAAGYGIGTAADPASTTEVHIVGFADNSVTDPRCYLNAVAATVAELNAPMPLLTSLAISAARVSAAPAAGRHLCAHYKTSSADRITCWGENGSHQVSSATAMSCITAEDPTPPASGWKTVGATASVSTSSRHSMALDAAGKLFGWGANEANELASIEDNGGIPTKLSDHLFSEIAAGADHACGITTARDGVLCWGQNRDGQIGDGSRYCPEAVAAGALP